MTLPAVPAGTSHVSKFESLGLSIVPPTTIKSYSFFLSWEGSVNSSACAGRSIRRVRKSDCKSIWMLIQERGLPVGGREVRVARLRIVQSYTARFSIKRYIADPRNSLAQVNVPGARPNVLRDDKSVNRQLASVRSSDGDPTECIRSDSEPSRSDVSVL